MPRLNLNRISASDMESYEEQQLFTIDRKRKTATPNPEYFYESVPTYDWNARMSAWIPRTRIR